MATDGRLLKLHRKPLRRFASESIGPAEILRYIHDALRKTRGAVAAIAEIRPDEQYADCMQAWGTSSAVVHERALPKPGFAQRNAGRGVPRIQEFKSEWPPDAVLVVHSDGLQSRWDLSSYAGLIAASRGDRRGAAPRFPAPAR